jgi:glycosyltransferase involved in cell wall biosynthesis
MQTVLIWDPNPFNWYGSEVSRIIAGGARRVVRYGRAGRAATGFGVTDRAIIPPPGGASSARGRARYLYAILEFVVRALCSRSPIVVPWITTTAEQVAVLCLVLLTRRTVVIDHNPVPGRSVGPSDPLLRRIKEGAATVVVHGEDLVDGVGRCRRLRVAEHPGYVAWWRRQRLQAEACVQPSPAAVPDGRRPTALFLGSLRWDKGAAELPALAEALAAHGVELVVACGKAETDLYEPLTNRPNLRLVADGRRYLTDGEIARCLRESDVLVVPYISVSRSGSVIMAAAAQLPMVGYHSRGLTQLAGDGAGVAVGDTAALADAVARCVSRPRAAPPGALADLESAARSGWLAVIRDFAS